MSKVIDVELRNIMKKFQNNVVVRDFNLQVEQGEFVSFLGPSGCGKTTTLNMIAGFLDPDEGELLIKGRRMNGVPPYKRELGMVFQTYSLFPHMTVAENVAYGLKLRKVGKAEMQERVKRVLELVKLPHVAERYPKQLSGGQRQRIAIARALVIEPSLLLLDEPLSNLDAKLREELRDELKRLHQEIGVTTIFVTHDQEEALSLSDRIVVLNHGRVEQIGTPEEIYNRPASEFDHTFIGKTNRLEGVVLAQDGESLTVKTMGGLIVRAARQQRVFVPGERVAVFVRPEKSGWRTERQRVRSITSAAS
ncbi:Spermidine/putrescine import ATP-binding protein PotA [Brevibacillus aydinogluensis]|uniref:Spermidine/putrescine import ATP-binding protein PotA n=1 Tax=Brevibacillus aydinogluensis TaxID=927786 RepID=A0AA48MAC7_9BACL|nr:Spermidine/putrescine import ATP-binding protein PotA [Brevibacillus aydinogluensis]